MQQVVGPKVKVSLPKSYHSADASISKFLVFNPILPGGRVKYAPLLFFLHHPKTAQGIKLKLCDFKDTLLRHILQVKPVR